MTPVPPNQPPAAPEDDVRLTEAERKAVNVAVDEAETCVCCGDDYGSTHVYAAVERIVAERVRVVEGERDEAEDRSEYFRMIADGAGGWRARADSAEAAHRALMTESAEAWRVAAQRRSEARRYYVAWQVARMRARALLAGGAR